MFPTGLRALLMCVSLVSANAAQLGSNLLFLPLLTYLGGPGLFSLLLLANISAGLFLQALLVETKASCTLMQFVYNVIKQEISPFEILRALDEQYWALKLRAQRVLSIISSCGCSRGSQGMRERILDSSHSLVESRGPAEDVT